MEFDSNITCLGPVLAGMGTNGDRFKLEAYNKKRDGRKSVEWLRLIVISYNRKDHRKGTKDRGWRGGGVGRRKK